MITLFRMNRKLLNDVRRIMLRRGFILQNRMLDENLSKPLRPHVRFPRKQSRFDRSVSDKEYINRLKSLSQK